MPAVEVHRVSKTFRPGWNWFRHSSRPPVRALDDVSLAVEAGEVRVLLGPNGSGKTTLLKILSTLLIPDAGRVAVCGADARGNARHVRRSVGFAIATERSFFQRLTASENLEFFASLEEVPRRERAARIAWALEQAGITDAAATLAYKLSSGMYQRLGIARAILKQPAVLLLDEPTRSIDPGGAARFWELVRGFAGAGTAVVLATHNFEEAAAVADQVSVLRQGALTTMHSGRSAASIAELRSFYFQQTEPAPATAPEAT
jgi:ABC-2 type transport system ATP-binding protein